MTQYQGSQAFNHNPVTMTDVNISTGSLSVNHNLINLPGIHPDIACLLELNYSAGKTGILGLPDGWQFNLPHMAIGKTLTFQGETHIIDPNWSDNKGHQSGIKYLNNHGIKFQEIIPAQFLPSGKPGAYSYHLSYADGSHDYFDATGKLLEHADIFGNTIHYKYQYDLYGIENNYLKSITDSYRQTVLFSYQANTIKIQTPDNSSWIINYSQRGVENIINPLNHKTQFDYTIFENTPVINQIILPSGLHSKILYTGIKARINNKEKTFPAVESLSRFDDEKFIDKTRYTYGYATHNTFTGYNSGYSLSGSSDALMDSNNMSYRYDILIKKLNSDNHCVSASSVFYNYLHLPVESIQHMIDDNGLIMEGHKLVKQYDIDPDYHVRTTNFTMPKSVERQVWSSDSARYLPQTKITHKYNTYGKPTLTIHKMYEPELNKFSSQATSTYAYATTNWQGQMPAEEIHKDHITGQQKQISYSLTPDHKCVETMYISYKNKDHSHWQPWKTKSYSFDKHGRFLSSSIKWSENAIFDHHSIRETFVTHEYRYKDQERLLYLTSTDAQNNKTLTVNHTDLPDAPIAEIHSPDNGITHFKYNALGQQTYHRNAEGKTSTKAYYVKSIDGINKVISCNEIAYIRETHHDVLGRTTKIVDNADYKTENSSTANRLVAKTSYNALGKPHTVTNHLGLEINYQYDSLSRETHSRDSLNNIKTSLYLDDANKVIHNINDSLHKIQHYDGNGRVIITENHPHKEDKTLNSFTRQTIHYDSQGRAITKSFHEVDSKTQSENKLQNIFLFYDVDGQVIEQQSTGYEQTQVILHKKIAYDLLGNKIKHYKTVTYANGNTYKMASRTENYNSLSQLETIVYQSGHKESYTYTPNGLQATKIMINGKKYRYQYDKRRLLSTITSGDDTITYDYYPDGSIQSINQKGESIHYLRYLDGKIKQEIYPNNYSQSYKLDNYGRLLELSDSLTIVESNSYDDKGRLKRKQQGNDKFNYHYGDYYHYKGILQRIELSGEQSYQKIIDYDGFGRRKSIKAINGQQQVLLASNYFLDIQNRLLQYQQTSNLHRHLNSKAIYQYDGLNQLIESTADRSTRHQQVEKNSSYSYDSNSNILYKKTNDHIRNYQFNKIDQLLNTEVHYDPNGNILYDGRNRYSYDNFDRLSSVTTPENQKIHYSYYPNGYLKNIEKPNKTIHFYYSNGIVNVIKTLSKNTDDIKWSRFLFIDKERTAAYENHGTNTYYFTGKGSTVASTSDGKHFDDYHYSAYGKPLINDRNNDQHKSFYWNQEYYDVDTGLVYLRARFYHPELMRFMSMDSYHVANKYSYCNGDPVNLIDPSGHRESLAGFIVGFTVTTAVTLIGSVFSFGAATPELVTLEAATVGAAANVAGHAAQAGVDGEKYGSENFLLDATTGAISNGIGTSVGAYTGKEIGKIAARKYSERIAKRVGFLTFGTVSGGFTSAVAYPLRQALTGKHFSISAYAESILFGAAGGLAASAIPTAWSIYKGTAPTIHQVADQEISQIVQQRSLLPVEMDNLSNYGAFNDNPQINANNSNNHLPINNHHNDVVNNLPVNHIARHSPQINNPSPDINPINNEQVNNMQLSNNQQLMMKLQ